MLTVNGSVTFLRRLEAETYRFNKHISIFLLIQESVFYVFHQVNQIVTSENDTQQSVQKED